MTMSREQCSLGVGCDEAGVCYAAAHGQPERCGAVADANRWRAVTGVYGGFQSRGGKMVAYISTPQWGGDWSDFNDAIDRHFEINAYALPTEPTNG